MTAKEHELSANLERFQAGSADYYWEADYNMECPVCRREVGPADVFCDGCGASLTRDGRDPVTVIGGAGPATATTASALVAATAGTLPGTALLLGDGEVVWRQYAVSQLRKVGQGQGTLFVTDARVVFYARAKGKGAQRASVLVQQTKVADVTGLTAFVSHRISIGWLVAVATLALLVLASLVSSSWRSFIVFGLLLAGAITMLVRGAAKRGSIGVQIHSGATQQSPIEFGQFGEQHGMIGQVIHNMLSPFLAMMGVYTAFDVLLGFPGRDAEKVIAELGALIFDLQTRGNLAGTHWGVAMLGTREPSGGD